VYIRDEILPGYIPWHSNQRKKRQTICKFEQVSKKKCFFLKKLGNTLYKNKIGTVDIPRTQMTLVLIGKGRRVLED